MFMIKQLRFDRTRQLKLDFRYQEFAGIIAKYIYSYLYKTPVEILLIDSGIEIYKLKVKKKSHISRSKNCRHKVINDYDSKLF